MYYKITLEPEGPLGTPLRSDTLFGHYCWTVALNEGDKGIAAVIERAISNQPDIIFSDGFPSGYLPIPIGLVSQLFFPGRDCSVSELQLWKQRKKIRWVKRVAAEKAGWKISSIHDENFSDKMPKNTEILRNVIDRFTGTSLSEYGLYQVSQSWYEGIWSYVDIYAFSSLDKKRFNKVVEAMFATGYGRDTTIGSGYLKLKEISEESLPQTDENSKFMSLSRMIPCGDIDIHNSRWTVEAKYGKLWQGTGNKNPFKFPIMQTIPGSVFQATKRKDVYGKVLTNVHKDDNRIIENCMAIPYPLPGNLYGNEEKNG